MSSDRKALETLMDFSSIDAKLRAIDETRAKIKALPCHEHPDRQSFAISDVPMCEECTRKKVGDAQNG